VGRSQREASGGTAKLNDAYTGTIDIQQAGDIATLKWEISAGRYVGVGRYHDTHLM